MAEWQINRLCTYSFPFPTKFVVHMLPVWASSVTIRGRNSNLKGTSVQRGKIGSRTALVNIWHACALQLVLEPRTVCFLAARHGGSTWLRASMGQQVEYTFWVLIFATLLVGTIMGIVSISRLLLAAVVVIVTTRYWRRIKIAIVMLPRDFRMLYRFGQMIVRNHIYMKRDHTVVSLFKERAALHPARPCFFFGEQRWSYADVQKYSNKVAQVFYEAGYRKGDVVGLFMGNCPEYASIWLGLAQLGVITALINNNLRSYPLTHSLNAAKVKAIIYGEEFRPAVEEVVGSLDTPAKLYQLGGSAPEETGEVYLLENLLAQASDVSPEAQDIHYNDKLLYIYTSGTTGLPKAAIMPHSRYLLITSSAEYLLALTMDDIFYNPLPMYHTAGGIIGTGPALLLGHPIVLRKKFSASAYWSDCIRYRCTIGQYIGEICRYILAVPPKPEDTAHSIRIMVGNGIRPSIWKEFVERFKIPQLTELYGSTEGNVNIINLDNKIGAIGAFPRFLPMWLMPIGLIKVDPNTFEPIRDEEGLCIRCDDGEPGMFVGLISKSNAIRDFHGYVDQSASSKKILYDVFRKGDRAFMSGDILVMDEYGYLYFKDRTGDTFRWKGENVATAEVESVIIDVIGLKDAAVYGVQIPEQDGKAGMAAIVDPNDVLDFKSLAEGFDRTLPIYARPIFIRVLSKLDMTGTFKIKKTELQREGFNPAAIKDRLYFHNGKEYVPLTTQLYQDIVKGVVRL